MEVRVVEKMYISFRVLLDFGMATKLCNSLSRSTNCRSNRGRHYKKLERAARSNRRERERNGESSRG